MSPLWTLAGCLGLGLIPSRVQAEVAPPPPSPELLAPARPAPPHADLHPEVILRDAQGRPVLDSRGPVSPLKTCGSCHDAEWISRHSEHAALGTGEVTALGKAPSGRAWDFGPGLIGRWDPFDYSSAPPPGADKTPGAAATWLKENGWRVIGGSSKSSPRVGEMDCFLCHVAGASNQERVREIEAGRVEWAPTASLSGERLFTRDGVGWSPARERFTPEGAVQKTAWRIGPPTPRECGFCHGVVHDSAEPITLIERTPRQRMTEAEGVVFSGQPMALSAINLVGKESLARPWDVHAERLVACQNCHFLPNDPAYAAPGRSGTPVHLQYEARRIALGEYLKRPDHRFSRGLHPRRATTDPAPMRRCETCHDARRVHGWLPRLERHLKRLECEACHIPRSFAPARRETDWSMLVSPGVPRVTYRGTSGAVTDPSARVDGYRPVLLPRRTREGAKLGPFNLVTTWLWTADDQGTRRPVPLERLNLAFFSGRQHHPELVRVLDRNHDQRLEPEELVLDTAEKVIMTQARLASVGVAGAKLVGEIEAYAIHHGVAPGRFALRKCQDCHAADSRVSEVFTLSPHAPSVAPPVLVGDAQAVLAGEILRRPEGTLALLPVPGRTNLYLLGHSRNRVVDGFGMVVVLGALVTALGHGSLRWRAARRRTSRPPAAFENPTLGKPALENPLGQEGKQAGQ